MYLSPVCTHVNDSAGVCESTGDDEQEKQREREKKAKKKNERERERRRARRATEGGSDEIDNRTE